MHLYPNKQAFIKYNVYNLCTNDQEYDEQDTNWCVCVCMLRELTEFDTYLWLCIESRLCIWKSLYCVILTLSLVSFTIEGQSYNIC